MRTHTGLCTHCRHISQDSFVEYDLGSRIHQPEQQHLVGPPQTDQEVCLSTSLLAAHLNNHPKKV